MRHIVRVKGHQMTQHVRVPRRVPRLAPLKLERLQLGQMFLNDVMGPLDQHPVEIVEFEHVSHRGRHAEWVDGPAVFGDDIWTEVVFYPFVSFDELVDHGGVVGIGLVRHHPAARHDLHLTVTNQS